MSRNFAIASFGFFLSMLATDACMAVEGPSFECSRGVRQTLAAILCSVPEAAQADWDLNSAYWALYSDDREEAAFVKRVNNLCSLPTLETEQERTGKLILQGVGSAILGAPLSIPGSTSVTRGHVRCVIDSYRDQARQIRAKLSGDALMESKLSPEEHVAVQQALSQKGFMQNRIKGFGISADGQFGPNTRLAINDFQRSLGVPATGFLTEDQLRSLIETPEQRRAREARIVMEEKSRRDALQAQQIEEDRRREEARKREAERIAAQEAAQRAEELAKQEAIDREKKKLADEAAKAAEWRRKIEEAQEKGAEYAKANDLSWSLTEKTNPMTDDKEYEVASTQTNGTGAVATVQGRCWNDHLRFEAVLQDASDSKVPLGLPGSSQGGLVGRKRINDAAAFASSFPLEKFRNKIVLSEQSFRQDDPEAADTTWRVLAELETSRGTLYVRIPMLDAKIQKLLAACKRQFVVNQRRQGPG